MASGDLNYRQRLFVEAYLGKANGNATEAARVVGYHHPAVAGCRMLRNVNVQAAVEAKLASAAMSANEVLARLSDQAAGDLSDFVTVSKKGLPALDLNKARKRNRLGLVKKLTPNQHGWAIELHDSQAALVHLAKYHGLLDGDKAAKGQVDRLPSPFEAALAKSYGEDACQLESQDPAKT